jgi:hypothetical protein
VEGGYGRNKSRLEANSDERFSEDKWFSSLETSRVDDILIYNSFNDAVSCSEYIVSNDRIVVVNRKGAGRKCSLPDSRYHPGLCLENHKHHQSGQLVTWPKFKLGTSRIQVGSVILLGPTHLLLLMICLLVTWIACLKYTVLTHTAYWFQNVLIPLFLLHVLNLVKW